MIQKNKIQYQKYILDPGYIMVAPNPAMLCSVCGNGVIVSLWDKLRKKGGMTHCIFPKLPPVS